MSYAASVSSLSYLDVLDSITGQKAVGMLSAYIKSPDELNAVRALKNLFCKSVSPESAVRIVQEDR